MRLSNFLSSMVQRSGTSRLVHNAHTSAPCAHAALYYCMHTHMHARARTHTHSGRRRDYLATVDSRGHMSSLFAAIASIS
jgi:hypothetical protein